MWMLSIKGIASKLRKRIWVNKTLREKQNKKVETDEYWCFFCHQREVIQGHVRSLTADKVFP